MKYNFEKFIIDFEVFSDDWLCVIINHTTREVFKFHNQSEDFKQFLKDHRDDVFIGHNIISYDARIMTAIVRGYNNAEIKRINDIIIADNDNIQAVSVTRYPIAMYDTMMTSKSGLKAIESRLGYDIHETTVPFNIDRKLTEAELAEVFKYCEYDVINTSRVFDLLKSDFEAHLMLCEEYRLPLVTNLHLTKPSISAKILEAKPKAHTDNHSFAMPIGYEISKYKFVVDWFQDQYDTNKLKGDDEKLETELAGCPHTIAWGGIHGALPNCDVKGNLINADVASYYPSLMIEWNLLSRNVSDAQKFVDVYKQRLAYKKAKNEKQAALKIVLNSTYGAAGYEHNKLYDPYMQRSVCCFGQIFLVDLIEHLESVGARIIQSNTDGVLFLAETPQIEELAKAECEKWQERSRMKLEFDQASHIIQRDVNYYVLIETDGSVKSKGRYIRKQAKYEEELPIVRDAILNYFSSGTSVADTINNCDELNKFAITTKLLKTYDYVQYGDEKLTTTTNRIFASSNTDDPTIYKVKNGGNPNKFADVPEHCIIINDNVIDAKCSNYSIDKNWYISFAQDKIDKFFETKITSKKSTKKAKAGNIAIVEEAGTDTDTNSIKLTPLPPENAQPIWIDYYVPCDSEKRCLGNFDDRKIAIKFEDLANYENVGAVIKPEYVCVDLDCKNAKEQMEALVKLFITQHEPVHIQKTTKGYHIICLKPNNKIANNITKGTNARKLVPAFGSNEVDYIYNHYIIVKHQGKMRDVVYQADHIGECPLPLMPVALAKAKKGIIAELMADGIFNFGNIAEGERNNTFNRWLYQVHQQCPNASVEQGVETALAMSCFIPTEKLKDFGYGEAMGVVASVWKSEIKSTVSDYELSAVLYNQIYLECPNAIKLAKDYTPSEEGIEPCKVLSIKANDKVIQIALRDDFNQLLKYKFFYDTFLQKVVCKTLENDKWSDYKPLQSEMYAEIAGNLNTLKMPDKIQYQSIRSNIILVAKQNEIDTGIVEYNSISNVDRDDSIWDEMIKRLRLIDNAEIHQSNLAACKFMLVSTLKRLSTKEEIKNDIAIVLKGPQGTRKSTFVETLCLNPNWYGQLDLSAKREDIIRQLKGKQIVELAELGGLKKADINFIKSFFASTKDEFIRKYEEDATVYNRRTIFVITTNDSEFLIDPTGNRRYAVLEIDPTTTKKIDIDWFREHKDELYAQAKCLISEYTELFLSVEKLFANINKQYVETDPWIEVIQRALYKDDKSENPLLIKVKNKEIITASLNDLLCDVFNFAQKDLNNQKRTRIKNCLESLGFDTNRCNNKFTVNGKRINCIVKK